MKTNIFTPSITNILSQWRNIFKHTYVETYERLKLNGTISWSKVCHYMASSEVQQTQTIDSVNFFRKFGFILRVSWFILDFTVKLLRFLGDFFISQQNLLDFSAFFKISLHIFFDFPAIISGFLCDVWFFYFSLSTD